MRDKGSGFRVQWRRWRLTAASWIKQENILCRELCRELCRLSSRQSSRQRIVNRPSAFTLIELLVVILLLTVLMLTAFPAFRGLERTTNRHRAVAEADALAQAALAYRRTYGQWPLEDRAEGMGATDTAIIAGRKDEVAPYNLELADVVAVLRNVRHTAAGPMAEPNPRRILFLELADDRLDSDGTPLDPWHQPYVLVMARVGDEIQGELIARREGGIIEQSITHSNPAKSVKIEAPEDVVAFSWGDPAMGNAEDGTLGSWSKR
jgi:prepilin-type N-terminal cleavage/methylation domain-containing protein